MNFDINWIAKFGPVFSAVIASIVYGVKRALNKKNFNVDDLFVVGMTGSAFPTGFLFLYAAMFQNELMIKLSETPIYIALAGIAMLYLGWKSIVEKINS